MRARIFRHKLQDLPLKSCALLFRSALILAAVTVAIAVPDFGVIMSLLGAFSAFTICVIGPLAAQIAINGKTTKDVVLLVLSIGMGAWGTGACVLDQLSWL